MNSWYEKEYNAHDFGLSFLEICLNSHKDQQLQAGLIAQLVRVLHCYHK